MDTRLILLSDVVPGREWLYEAGIPQAIHRRLSKWGPTHWLAHKPSAKFPDPDRAHREFLGPSPLRRMAQRTKRAVKVLAKRLSDAHSRPYKRFAQVVGYHETIRAVLMEARLHGASRVALVKDHHVTVSADAIDFALRVADEEQADLLCCTQVDGLLPVVVSTQFLEKWLQSDGAPDVRQLWAPACLSDFGLVLDLQLVSARKLPGHIRCAPVDQRETSLLRFWKSHAPALDAALRARPDKAGAGREQLDALIEQYRAEVVAGLETYDVIGSLAGVDDVRRRMVTTDKPLVDYFVVAMHLGRFLRRYARLNPSSHVVDVGCSWGYFGFALANYLAGDGAYVGIEVQEAAVQWARQRLGWLGEQFRFEHLDIYNAFYNPRGTIPRDGVRLPIPDAWADVILAGSVFTHMTEDGVRSYLTEFRRILRPQGIAAFSYDDTSFFGGDGDAVVVHGNVPDKATVYSRNRIAQMVHEAGLTTARMPVNFRLFGRTDFQTWYFAGVPDSYV